MISEYLLPCVLLALTVYVAYSYFSYTTSHSHLPSIPVIGARKGDFFPHIQARWRNLFNFKAALELAQAQHKGKTVLVPIAIMGDIVVMPPAEINFIADAPGSTLAFKLLVEDDYQLHYTFMDSKIPRLTLHESLLRTALTPHIPYLIPVLVEEIAWNFDRLWGTDTEWHDVCPFETLHSTVGGVANRAFVGLPFCRDPMLTGSATAFAGDIPITGYLLKMFPEPIRAFVAPLITLPNRYHTWQFRKVLLSEIDRRLRDFDNRQANPNDKSLSAEPKDLLQWWIQQAKAGNDPYMWQSQTLADCILILNFASVYTLTFTSVYAIFDLVASTPETIDALRTEIETVLSANDGEWSKKSLAQMEKLDSAIRESSRISSILSVGLKRLVVAEKGMVTPSGVLLPKGTRVAVAAYSHMRDDEIYEDAKTYKPFRFSDQNPSKQNDESLKREPNTIPTATPEFLSFGLGKHACPGRFFAAAELKIIIAYAILNYDFEMRPEALDGAWIGHTRLPPMKATIKVRWRTDI